MEHGIVKPEHGPDLETDGLFSLHVDLEKKKPSGRDDNSTVGTTDIELHIVIVLIQLLSNDLQVASLNKDHKQCTFNRRNIGDGIRSPLLETRIG